MSQLPGDLRVDFPDQELEQRLNRCLQQLPKSKNSPDPVEPSPNEVEAVETEPELESTTSIESQEPFDSHSSGCFGQSSAEMLERMDSSDTTPVAIHFKVRNGHVTVEGDVATDQQKREILNLCRRVAGVIDLEDHLTVR